MLNIAEVNNEQILKLEAGGEDHVARIIFLNLVVDDEKVVSYKMTKAFSNLEKAQNVLNGRPQYTPLKHKGPGQRLGGAYAQASRPYWAGCRA